MIHDLKMTLELFELVKKRKLKSEQMDRALALIGDGADPNYQEPDYPNNSILRRVMKIWNAETRIELLKALITAGADLNLPSDIFFPLWHAVQTRDVKVTSLFIENKVKKGIGAGLKLAIENDSIEMVRQLIPLVDDLNKEGERGSPFLSDCCEAYRVRDRKKDYDVMPGITSAKLLIESGAHVGGTPGQGSAPLFSAIQGGFVALLELLLENGAELEGTNQHGPTIFIANDLTMAQALFDAGVDINEQDAKGKTVLMNLLLDADIKMVEFFIAKGVDIYALNKEGATAFHYATRFEETDFLEQLLAHYDLQKCNEILPLLKYLEDHGGEAHILKFLADKLGIVQATADDEAQSSQPDVPLTLDSLMTEAGVPVYTALKNDFGKLLLEIMSNDPDVLGVLPPFERLIDRSVFDPLMEQLTQSARTWFELCEGKSIQALYVEYGGDTVSPFDTMGLFWGYTQCDEGLNLAGEIFESGFINLASVFDGISRVLKDFAGNYQEVKAHYENAAFRIVHLAFGQFIQTEEFKALPTERPFYLVGGAHEGKRQLIFKL